MADMRIRGAKAGQKQPRKPNISKDTAASISTAKLLYGLAEGEIYGLADGAKSIRLDGTPLVDDAGNPNFEGVTWDFRNGSNDQEYIKGFPDVSNETPINVELRSSQPWIKAFNDTQISAVRVRFKWNRLSETNGENGDVKGYKIDYAIDLQTDGGAYQTVLTTKIQDKTSAGYERTHRIDLPKAKIGWQLRVRRITPNSTSDLIQDTMMIDAVAEVIDVKLSYPNTALLGVQYNAELFSNVAKMSVRVKGKIIRVPDNYDPVARTYTGIWTGNFKDAYSNNPAWVFYDLCTQWRGGLGERLDATMIDRWSLYALGQYCDQPVSDGQGGLEPRFTCNVYLQKQEEAYTVLQNIAGIFRAMSFWTGERIMLDADVPQDPIYTYSSANIVGGVAGIQYSGTRNRDRHTLAKVAWDNPNNDYQTEYEYVRDEKAMSKFGVKVLDLSAFGCTSQAQAQRAGLWALKTEQLETRQVTFSVGLDGAIPTVGNIISLSDEAFAGRANGGRVSTVNSTQRIIELDREVTASVGDVLIINGGSGKSERRNISNVVGNRITVTAGFTGAEPEHVWAIETADLKLMRFRVMSIIENDDATYAITAIQHEPQKYDAIDFGTDVKPTEITIINPDTVDAPASVAITSRHREVQGQTVTTLIISWSQVKGAVAYDAEWRKDDGTWVKVPRTGNVSAEIDGVYSGNYVARVRAISAFDVQSQATTSILTEVKGKIGLPPTVVGLTATGVLFGMDLKWGFQQGSGDADYTEIQVGSAPNVNVATLGQYSYPTNTHTINGLQGNLSQSYRARLVDKLGFKSEWSAWVTGTTDANADKIMDLIQGQIDESAFSDIMKGRIDDIEINKEAISQEVEDRIAAITAANDRITDEAADRVEALRLESERTDGLQQFADELAEDVDTVTLAQIETEQGVAAVKERTEAIEIENGLQASKLTYLSSEIDFGYADKTQYADKSRATVWTFAKTVAHADYTNAQLITGLSADYKDSSARFTENIELLATKNEATATKTTNLSAQIVGGYDGNDLTKLNSGLIFEESKARATDVEALAEQISLLSAGVGEQFDSFDIWHFDKNMQGWTGGAYHNGYLRVQSGTVTSPTIEDLDGGAYRHVKLRIKKEGQLTWVGKLSYNGGSKTIAEPSYDTDGFALVNWQMEWSGDITSFSLELASSFDGISRYLVDWIAVGRPSPGASNASLLRESKVRASETSANASDLVALRSKIEGGNGVPIESSITRKLETTANLASTTAEDLTILTSTYEDEMYGYEGTVQTTARTLGEATRAEAERLDLLSANVLPSYADKTQYASSTRSTQWTYAKTVAADNYASNQRITNLQSEFADSNANFTNELFTLATKDKAIAADITQLYAETGANYGLIQDVSIAISTPNTGLAAKVTELQSSAQINAGAASAAQQAANAAATAAGNKGEVIYGSTAPSADKQKAQNLWIDTSGGKNTPKRWAVNAWLTVTDKAATDAAAAASAAQGTANSALTAAQAAQQAATASTVKLAEIAADNKLTPTEKRQVKTIWEEIKKTDASIREQAAKYSVPTASYDYVYTALTDYLVPLMGNMGQTNTIVRDTFDGRFANLYERRAELYAAITSATEQATSLANSNAAVAQQAADAAESKAQKAKEDLSDIYSDGKVTPSEKKQIKTIWTEIVETDVEVRANAAKYGVPLGTYPEAYTNLENLINTLWLDNNTTANVDRTTIDSRFEIYYRRRAIINRNIVTAAEQATKDAAGAASAAQGAAEAAKDAADEADRKARVAQGQVNDISADGKLTPVEKKQVKLIIDDIKQVDVDIKSRAAKYEVSTTEYGNAYTALVTNYINALLTNPNATDDIDRNVFNERFNTFFTKRAQLDSAITVAAKKVADDAQQAASAAQGTANSALGAAQAAQGAADAAEGKAQKAKEDLSDIYSDGKITPSEKQQIKTIWTEIVETDVEVRANATKYEVNLGTYPAAYTALENYVDWLLLDMSTTTGVNRNDMDSRFEIYYRRRAAVNRAIVSAAEKQAADAAAAASAAQGTANGAQGAASAAQQAANAAQGAADAAEEKAVLAQSALTEIAADNKLTAVEKKQLIVILADINKTDTEVRSNAAKYSVSLTAYNTAYSALTSYINPKLTDMTATSTIDRAVFNARFDTLYLKRSDVNAAIVAKAEAATAAAQGSANSAAQAASNAQAAADAAAQVAASATIKLSDIAADDKLTPIEKNQVLTIWEEIKKTDVGIRASATKYGVSVTAYDNVYTTLNSYLTPLMNVPEQTSTIVRDTFDGRFANLYTQRSALNNAIVAAIKSAGDATDSKAVNAAAAASAAQTTANSAASVAAAATVKLTDIAADDKLTPLEKNQVLTIWEEIKSADASVRASAAKYGVSTVAYDNVYTALNTYLTPLMNVPEQTSTIVRATFDGRFANLYARRAELNNAIVAATKAISDSLSNKLEPANLASLVEGSGAFSDEFGSISGQFANFEAVVEGQKTAMEVISGIGNAEKLKNEIAKARLDKNVTNLNAQSVALQNAIDSYTSKIADLNAKRNAPKPPDMTQAKYNELRAEYAKQIVDITEAKADLTAQKAVIADQVAQLAAEKKVLDDFKEVEDGVRAQHTVKIDNDGKIVGFGLVLQKDGFSTFDVRADRFSISAPSDKPNDVNGNSPFMVLTNPQNINGVQVDAGTYMRNFYAPRGSIDTLQVADGAITTAKIGDLQVDTAQIANGAIETAKIDNLAVTTGKIDNLAVKSANIDNLAVTSGKIANLAVDTLQIADNAVTIPASRYEAGDISSAYNDWGTVFSLNVDQGGFPALVDVTMEGVEVRSSIALAELVFRIIRGSHVVRTIKVPTGNYTSTEASKIGLITFASIVDDVPTGGTTYHLQIRFSGVVKVGARSLTVLGVKK